jgi:hypothetical protein
MENYDQKLEQLKAMVEITNNRIKYAFFYKKIFWMTGILLFSGTVLFFLDKSIFQADLVFVINLIGITAMLPAIGLLCIFIYWISDNNKLLALLHAYEPVDSKKKLDLLESWNERPSSKSRALTCFIKSECDANSLLTARKSFAEFADDL